MTTADLRHTGPVSSSVERPGDDAVAPREPSEREDFWRRALAGWDAVFYALLAICAVSMLAVEGTFPPGGPALAALGGLALLLVAYLVLGRRGALTGDLRLTRSYVVVLIVVVALAGGINSLGSILLFIGFSQVWFFAADLREGVVASVVMAVATTTSMAVGEQAQGRDLVVLAGQMAIGLIFSLALGFWITRVAERSEERAALIEELETAQAQLAASNHAAGVLAERERVAQEIHDTLAQGFTSVVMLAQTAQAQIDLGQDAQARDRLAQIERVARENLAEARALVAAFGPAALADSTLTEALERLAERFGAETGVRVEVSLSDVGDAGRDTEVVLLRAAQEALANVRKHAGARRVLLRLVRSGGEVALEVLDDGQGLAPGTAEGVGLRGMRERVAAGGGTLDVAGEPGRGTRVRLAMPLAARDDDEAATA
ncbi:Sensor histidine kinase LiaS [Cellulomonas hominis]|nr:Sensor histidine kinase LiaS [Cellulomonas hominis]